MIGLDEVALIINRLPFSMPLENGINSEDVACIVCRTDVFECGDDNIVNRHIDIEFTFGEYIEVHEKDAVFQYICTQSGLHPITEQGEVIIYQKQ